MAESVLAEETGMVTPNMNARQMELTREEIYRDWLGLKCTTPSHYGLLGVPELEHDATAILHAGRRVKRKLRAYQIGPYRKQALNMLSEVGQAVSVLTNAEKKRAYDRELFARWRGTLEELYKLHCDGKPRDAAVLDAWLSACMARGVPVTRLLPAIIFDLGPRLKEWPPHGEHKVNLLVNMWIYRDAVVLGAALHLGTLEQRVEAVKRVQKVLGLTEGQARVVAEEVTRGLHLFTKTRLVGLAKADPEMFLVRLGRRIRRYGGHLGRHGAAVAALALLLAMSTKRLGQVFDRLAEKEESPSSGRKTKHGLRHGQGRVAVIGLAVVAGVGALVMAVLVATGAWSPWKQPDTPPPAPPVTSKSEPPPAPGKRPPRPALKQDNSDLPDLLKFAKKYPTGNAPPATEPTEPSDTPDASQVPVLAPKSKSKPNKPVTTFFNVPAEQRQPGEAPPETESPAPKPAPKAPATTPKRAAKTLPAAPKAETKTPAAAPPSAPALVPPSVPPTAPAAVPPAAPAAAPPSAPAAVPPSVPPTAPAAAPPSAPAAVPPSVPAPAPKSDEKAPPTAPAPAPDEKAPPPAAPKAPAEAETPAPPADKTRMARPNSPLELAAQAALETVKRAEAEGTASRDELIAAYKENVAEVFPTTAAAEEARKAIERLKSAPTPAPVQP